MGLLCLSLPSAMGCPGCLQSHGAGSFSFSVYPEIASRYFSRRFLPLKICSLVELGAALLSLLLLCQNPDQKQLGEERVYLAHGSQSHSISEEKSGQDSDTDVTISCLPCFVRLTSPGVAPSTTTQQSRGCPTPQIHTQANLMEAVPQVRFPLPSKASVRLTM